MNNVSRNLRELAVRIHSNQADEGNLGARLATALNWDTTEVRRQQLFADKPETPISKGLIGSQPAAIFLADLHVGLQRLINAGALYAYHASIEWGLVTNATDIVIFNSHWVRKGHWFHLPSIPWEKFDSYIDLFEAVTPEGLTYGKIEQVAARFFEPDRLLMPVDDALVDRLDHWRDEAMRFTSAPESVDQTINQLFAQMFVLRAVEDRRLAPEVPSLDSLVDPYGKVAVGALAALFKTAHTHLQSELFDDKTVLNIPPAILGGIITDLYVPPQLPVENARYNFAWIDADILGRAYEKYLAELLVPSSRRNPQLSLLDEPVRESDRVSVRKAAGIYYTPQYLVNYLTEYCLDAFFESEEGNNRLPRVADLSCGSGSFLIAARQFGDSKVSLSRSVAELGTRDHRSETDHRYRQ
jgi:hypothetical protein